MIARTITATEARAILANEEAESLPFRIINAAGRAAVAQFVNREAAEPERHSLDAWYSEAEQAANDASEGAGYSIEMSQFKTASRTPRVLWLEDEYFDWIIND